MVRAGERSTGAGLDDATAGNSFVEVRETHSGVVILLGDRAFKLKKPVDLGFLDFTALEDRWSVCRSEVELNSRLAPDVYLGVGRLEAPPSSAEPLVVMRRMPSATRLTTLVARGHANPSLTRDLARAVAAFHSRADRGPVISKEGTSEAIGARWEASFAQCAPFRTGVFDDDVVTAIQGHVREFLAGRRALFDDRVARGLVVDGHGDLMADDIFCLPDGPRILDCLEFDDRLRYLDQLDDISFLAMDLERLGAPDLATSLLASYVEFANDPAPPALLHHFLAYRAFVRAKVSALRSAQHGSGTAAASDARRFAQLAVEHLRLGTVNLVLVGGPPGSGKTTLAGHVADLLGMVVLSSDRVRKELAGLDPLAPAEAPFEHGIYDPLSTERTYSELLRRARLLLERGESVVLDASWSTHDRRSAAADLAGTVSARLTSLRCCLDEGIAAARIRARVGVSDADEEVAAIMRAREEPWPDSVAIDTSQETRKAADTAAETIRPHVDVAAARIRSAMEPG